VIFAVGCVVTVGVVVADVSFRVLVGVVTTVGLGMLDFFELLDEVAEPPPAPPGPF
jgi:hypothetical protein